MSTGFLIVDVLNKRVFRQVRATVTQVGNTITAATAETSPFATSGLCPPGPRACQFRGSNDLYTQLAGDCYRYNEATEDWDLVYTAAGTPDVREAYNWGPVVLPVDGVATLVYGYSNGATNMRIVKSTDGVNFTESANITQGSYEGKWNFRVVGTVIKFFARVSSAAWLYTVNPTTEAISTISISAQGGGGGSVVSFVGLRFKGRDFYCCHDAAQGTRVEPTLFEDVGGSFTKLFQLANNNTSDNGFNVDQKWAMFESSGKLIVFAYYQDNGAGDTSHGWHAFSCDTTGVGGALQVESEITDTIFPSGLGRNSSVGTNSAFYPIIDYEANLAGEPEIGLLFRGVADPGNQFNYYIWNGIAALIGNNGVPHDVGSDTSFGTPHDPSGSSKYFWTRDGLDAAIDAVTPALGGEIFQVTMFAPPSRVVHGAVTAGPFENSESVSSSGGGTATIARAGVGSGFLLLDNVVGSFGDGDTITQTTGTNSGANALQSGAINSGSLSAELSFSFQRNTDTEFAAATISATDVGTLNAPAKKIEALTATSEGTTVNATLDTPGDGIASGEIVDIRANVEAV